jgi:hypothetical protein
MRFNTNPLPSRPIALYGRLNAPMYRQFQQGIYWDITRAFRSLRKQLVGLSNEIQY